MERSYPTRRTTSLLGYEHGRRLPALTALAALAEALHCRPGELLDDAT